MTRPSLDRKVTSSSEKNRKAELDQGVKVTLDGHEHVLRLGDVSATIARTVRRTLGQSVNALIAEASTDPDIDTIQAIVWVSRLTAGEVVDLDDVAVDYGLVDDESFDITIAEPSSAEDGDLPEA